MAQCLKVMSKWKAADEREVKWRGAWVIVRPHFIYSNNNFIMQTVQTISLFSSPSPSDWSPKSSTTCNKSHYWLGNNHQPSSPTSSYCKRRYCRRNTVCKRTCPVQWCALPPSGPVAGRLAACTFRTLANGVYNGYWVDLSEGKTTLTRGNMKCKRGDCPSPGWRGRHLNHTKTSVKNQINQQE